MKLMKLNFRLLSSNITIILKTKWKTVHTKLHIPPPRDFHLSTRLISLYDEANSNDTIYFYRLEDRN